MFGSGKKLAKKQSREATQIDFSGFQFAAIFQIYGHFLKAREVFDVTDDSVEMDYQINVEAQRVEGVEEPAAFVTNTVTIKGFRTGEEKTNPLFEIESEFDLVFFSESEVKEEDLRPIEIASLFNGWPYSRAFAVEASDKMGMGLHIPVSTPPPLLVTFASEEKKLKASTKAKAPTKAKASTKAKAKSSKAR